ncbi:MAG: flagella basal body P-ring formation protein FlgA [Gemmatirosa sp.]
MSRSHRSSRSTGSTGSTGSAPAPQGWLLSPALARLAACGAHLMLVIPVLLPAQQRAQPPHALARAAAVARPAAAPEAVAPTAARDLPRGHVLAATDISPATPSLVGWTTRRVVTAGQALREPAVARPLAASAISAGQQVAVIWRDQGIALRMNGVAVSAAPIGARVKVRLDARRRLEGTVVAPGVVQLP